jgi:hypothetical protein
MKNVLKISGLTLGALLSFGVMASDGGDAPRVIEVSAPVKAVFIPKGFDSNDDAQVIVAGAYPNSCYKVGPTTVSVDKETQTVNVAVNAYYTADSYCLMLYIPFTQAINVGVLPAGKYQVVVNKTPRELMPVSLATRDQLDDYLYATVSALSRVSRETFQLQGYLPNSCAAISEIRVIEEPGNVLTVLPIVKFAEGCSPSDSTSDLAFSESFEVPAGLKGQKLIHVRSLNGSSINQVMDF